MSKNHEHLHQVAFFKWLSVAHPKIRKLSFAVPNGGKRDKVTAAILKSEGVTAGVADIIILAPSKKYHGLLIEMKSSKGRLSVMQKKFLNDMDKEGFLTYVCHSVDAAIEATIKYLKDR